MPRVQSALASFVLQGGTSVEGTGYLALDARGVLARRAGQTVNAIFEPLEPSPNAEALAAELADHLALELEARRNHSATAALLSAIETTNDWLAQLNAVRPARERQYFGFTCVLCRGEDAYIAQAAPSQILIAQEGELYAFPGLDHWRWHQQATDHIGQGAPLGWDEAIQPDLYHTALAAGDVIVLCSSSLARVIDRAPQEALASSQGEDALFHLEDLARLFAVSDAWAAVLPVVSREPTTPRRSGDLAFLARVSGWFSHLLPEETARRIRPQAESGSHLDDREPRDRGDDDLSEQVDLRSGERHTLRYAKELAADDAVKTRHWDESFAGTDEFPAVGPVPDAMLDETPKWEATDEESLFWAPEGLDASTADEDDEHSHAPERRRRVNELVAGAILALSAAVVGVRQMTVGRDRLHGPRDDGTLGVPRLSRYDDTYQMPDMSGVRSRLPRLPISRPVALALVVLLVAVSGALAFAIHTKQVREHQAALSAALQTVESQRQAAAKAPDATSAQAALQSAQASLTKAQALGLDARKVATEQAAINGDLDRVLKVERLANVQVLGSLPPAPAGVTPRIFSGNGQLYVFSDALYRLDNDGTTLVRLIGGGDKIGGQPVSTLVGAAWGDGAPLVFDGSNAYLFDPPTGTWSRKPVGTMGGALGNVVGINGYAGNLYLLSPSTGQIIKYSAGAFDSKPEDWTGGQAATDLKSAVDFEIDGRIYVLLQDGRVLDLYRSALQATITPQVSPAITKAIAFSLQTDRPYYYIADAGRIMRLNRANGTLVQQFLPGDGAPAFNDIRDIAVDDILSTAYILNGNTLLTVRLPGPPR